jgi:starch-binding outer membrane protein, SusD/RagB family
MITFQRIPGRVGRGRRSRTRGVLLAVAVAFSATACDLDSFLEVEDPTAAAPGTVQTEGAAATTLAAAIGAFQLGFSGAPGGGSFIDSQVTIAGIMSDEFFISESFPTRIDADQRETQFDNATMLAAYARMQTARRLAEFSADLHSEFTSTTNTTNHAHALNIAGFSYIIFGENYCSGVPFSYINPDGSVDFGAPLSTSQMFEQAIALFDQATTAANAALAAATTAAATANATAQLNLARVGKGRALLNLANDTNDPTQTAAAAATVAAVPTDFVYRIFHSLGSGRQNNGIWGANWNRRGVTVADSEGGTGLPYRTAADPRVRVVRGASEPGTGTAAFGFDGSTPLWLTRKYPTQTSSVILASGVEARLIEAEHQLRTGGAWLTTLNALRSAPPATAYPATEYPDIGSLTALADPGSEADRVSLLFRERAYWMWLTSHRVGDLRRLMRQYNRTDAQAGWPTGSYPRGGDYGDHVSMLVPFDELNNPEFRAAFPQGCDPTIP